MKPLADALALPDTAAEALRLKEGLGVPVEQRVGEGEEEAQRDVKNDAVKKGEEVRRTEGDKLAETQPVLEVERDWLTLPQADPLSLALLVAECEAELHGEALPLRDGEGVGETQEVGARETVASALTLLSGVLVPLSDGHPLALGVRDCATLADTWLYVAVEEGDRVAEAQAVELPLREGEGVNEGRGDKLPLREGDSEEEAEREETMEVVGMGDTVCAYVAEELPEAQPLGVCEFTEVMLTNAERDGVCDGVELPLAEVERESMVDALFNGDMERTAEGVRLLDAQPLDVGDTEALPLADARPEALPLADEMDEKEIMADMEAEGVENLLEEAQADALVLVLGQGEALRKAESEISIVALAIEVGLCPTLTVAAVERLTKAEAVCETEDSTEGEKPSLKEGVVVAL